MKKLIALLISVAFMFGVSCSNSNENTSDNQASAIDYSTMEVVRWEADRVICYNYEELEEYSEFIIIGTVIDDAQTKHTFGNTGGIAGEVLTYISSTNTVRVDKVLKGDLNINDEIPISQSCGVYENQFITFSDMEPLVKGDQWIFCLQYFENSQKYCCVGDYSSRFPVPSGQSATLSRSVNANTEAQLVSEIEKMTQEDFGVYSDVTPMKDLYYDVITRYDCTLQ